MPTYTTISSFTADADTVVILLVEHLGDIIASEPVIRYAKRAWPGKKIAWVTYAKYADILAGHPDLTYLVETESLYEATEWAKSLPEGCVVLNLHFHSRKCTVTGKVAVNANNAAITKTNYFDYGSLLEIFCTVAGIPPLQDAPEYHFPQGASLPPLPERYVVIHCKSNDLSKDWKKEEWRALYDYFAAQGIYTLEIGLTPILGIDAPLYRDMTHVHSLPEIAGIIRNAHFFFGIESAFAHLANALRTDGLVIMGAFTHWARYRPYTGFYRTGKIVEPDTILPARFVPAAKVIARYEDARKGIKHTEDDTVIRLNDDFPNPRQSFVLRKLYRPLVRRLANPDDYVLFWDYPLLYLNLTRSPDPLRPLFRTLLRLLGPVPETVTKAP